MRPGRGTAVSLVIVLAWAVVSSSGAAAGEGTSPTARDDVVSVLGPTTVLLDVLANDTWAAPVVVTVDPPAHGTAGVVAAPTDDRPRVSYRAAAEWFGTDSFAYSLTDAFGVTVRATVRVTVRPLPPVAQADSARTTRGTAVAVAVLGNDRDPYGGALRILLTSRGRHGTTSIVHGRVVYRPARGFTGSDRFRYVVVARSGARAGGTVVVTTSAPTVVRVALLAPAAISTSMTATLVGSVSSLTRGVPAVTLQYLGAAGWTTFTRTTPDSSGSFAARFTTNGSGVITWRAVATWAHGRRLVSSPFAVRVVATAAPVVSGPLTPGDVPFSWRPGCPVSPSSLRRLTISYWGFDGIAHRGDLVVVAAAVPALVRVLSTAFATRFPIRSMIPVDAYYADGARSPTESDLTSMAEDNTSAFNCRPVTGDPSRVSQHAYGNAIDVNPFENPYVTATGIYPVAAAGPYVQDRTRHVADPGVLTSAGAVVRAFLAAGWQWGGRWARRDYQHVSANGR